ncbi:MAG: SDR family oxidoreductase [Paraglaciecola sp.]|nr:SDR family oxidoreductase [Paraglaciecola sp.]
MSAFDDISARKKKAIVTGAGDSVGKAAAIKLANNGYNVHICDVNPVAVASTLKEFPELTGTVADVSNFEDVQKIFEEANVQEHGLDVLINCVGLGGPIAPIELIAKADWIKTFDVNVHGILYTMQQAIPLMKKNEQGRIINFSTASTRTRLPNRSAYIASKAAVEGLTLNAARELGPFGITCNVIQPGIIDNQRMTKIIHDKALAKGKSVEEVNRDYLRYISTRSKTSINDIADTLLFLCSSSAKNITGELIALSGNMEWES